MNPGDSEIISIPGGRPVRLILNHPVWVVIETYAGSVIKCLSTPNDPVELTAFSDIKSVTYNITDQSLSPIHLFGEDEG